jgi:hypothetical protein
MTQHQAVGWNADGNFTQEAEGTQTNNMIMAEGDIVMKEDEHGRPMIDLEHSTLTHVLITSPSAQDASNALAQAFAASTAQAELFGRTLDGIMQMVVPLIGTRTGQPAAAVDSEGNCATCGRKAGD